MNKQDTKQTKCKCNCHFTYAEACTGLHPISCEHCQPKQPETIKDESKRLARRLIETRGTDEWTLAKLIDDELTVLIRIFTTEIKQQAYAQGRNDALEEVEELEVMRNEFIGLPVTQSQEQDNYNKKQRNRFRSEFRTSLQSLKKEKK